VAAVVAEMLLAAQQVAELEVILSLLFLLFPALRTQ
jgi:hypothetical protein